MITQYPYVYYPGYLPLRVRQVGRRCRILARLDHRKALIQFLDRSQAYAYPSELRKEIGK